MSRAIRYVERTHCGETVGHILRDLPVLRIQTGRAQSATKGEMRGLTQAATD